MKSKTTHLTLKILNSIFAALYVLVYISEFITSNATFNAEGIGYTILALIFLTGFVLSWKHELVTGYIYLGWNIGVWVLELFFQVQSSGFGIISGVPLLALAVFFIIAGTEKQKQERLPREIRWKTVIRVLTIITSILYLVVIVRDVTGGLPINYFETPGLYLLLLIPFYILGLAITFKYPVPAAVIFMIWYLCVIMIFASNFEIRNHGPWNVAGFLVFLNGLLLLKQGVDRIEKNKNQKPILM